MCQCASLKLSSSQLKVYGESVSKKICKIPEKISKKWEPQKSARCYTGCSWVSTCLKCSPCVRLNFRADIIDSPPLSPKGPPFCYRVFNQFFKFVLKKNSILCFFSMLQSGKFWVLSGQIRLLSGLIFLLSPYAIRKVWSVFRTHLWAFRPYLVFSGFFAFSVGKIFYQ